MEFIVHWVTQYGYAGLFILLLLGIVGIPIPDEILLLFSGYLIAQGKMALIPTIGVSVCGTVCGITLSYVLGRTLGVHLVNRYGHYFRLTDEKLDRGRRWFQRVGRWSLFFGYFVPGIRHVMAYLAGTTRLGFGVFALFAYTGGFFWSLSFILAGKYFGTGWMRMPERIHRIFLIMSGFVILILIIYFLVKKKRKVNN
jgi:membrane protein DedA with SNARE-associated domain